jgi:hypothetical protein
VSFDKTDAEYLLRFWDAAMVLTGKLNQRIEGHVADKTFPVAGWRQGLLVLQVKRNTLMQALAVAEIALTELDVPLPVIKYHHEVKP